MTKKHNHHYARGYGFWREHIHGIPGLEYTKRNQRTTLGQFILPIVLQYTKEEFSIDPKLELGNSIVKKVG